MTRKTLLWSAVNNAVARQAELAAKKTEQFRPAGQQEPPEALKNLVTDAKAAATAAAEAGGGDQPPPLIVATLAFFDNYDDVCEDVRRALTWHKTVALALLIGLPSLLVIGAAIAISSPLWSSWTWATLLGGGAFSVGSVFAFFVTKPIALSNEATFLMARFELTRNKYRLQILGCRNQRDLTNNADLGEVIECVAQKVDAMLAELSALAKSGDSPS